MCARYFSLIVSTKKDLPSNTEMQRLIAAEQALRKLQFPKHHKSIPALCDFLTKYDSLAKLIGCDVAENMMTLFWRHPVVWFHVLTKTLMSSQFKLTGPQKYTDQSALHLLLSRPPTIPYPVLFIEFIV